MSIENNKALARKLTELLDHGDVNKLKDILSPNFISHFAGLPQPLNRDQYIQVNQTAKAAFSDLNRTVEDMIAEGEQDQQDRQNGQQRDQSGGGIELLLDHLAEGFPVAYISAARRIRTASTPHTLEASSRE